MFSSCSHYISIELFKRFVMNNNESKYTTIQIRKEINEHIRKFCKDRGIIASTITEKYWLGLISSSITGSILV